jgi:hypothetical protein
MGVRMFARIFLCLSFLVLAGCASTQLNYNTLEISSTIDSVYTKQTLGNLSKFIDDPHAIPSQVILAGGTFQTVNTLTPSVTFPLTTQVADTVTNSISAVTAASARTVAGAGAGISGTNTAQQNYTVAPLNDANTLRNQQALYRHAVFGTSLIEHFTTPRVFFQNAFYDDPYQLQLPHCVLCAVKQGVFTNKKPEVRENPSLPGKWLYWDDDPAFKQLQPFEDFIALGHYGRHDLFMKKTDYMAGVLTKFVLFTLPNTAPAEVFVAFPAETGQPHVAVPGAPATNSRINPAERQNFNLIIPQGIVPSQ